MMKDKDKKSNKTTMHKRGHRKTLYRKYMIDEGYKLGVLGLTCDEIADFWNVGKSSLCRWMANNPEFKASVDRGRNEADMTVIQALLTQCRAGNITGIIFWLKNRKPEQFRDRRDIDVKGMKGAQVNVFKEETIVFADIDDDLDDDETKQIHADQSASGNRITEAL